MSEYCCAATSVSPTSEVSENEDEGVEEQMDKEGEMVEKAIAEAESEEQSKGEKGIDGELACGPCGGEDAQVPKSMKEPPTPSADEIAQHYLTHVLQELVPALCFVQARKLSTSQPSGCSQDHPPTRSRLLLHSRLCRPGLDYGIGMSSVSLQSHLCHRRRHEGSRRTGNPKAE